ncbi:hypothetical protein BU15DRAFT_68363 [Melanogaster broomeanus]|nr:hypothetical protein BU15DRAFT_68363 [Melanogaster broomeanus]
MSTMSTLRFHRRDAQQGAEKGRVLAVTKGCCDRPPVESEQHQIGPDNMTICFIPIKNSPRDMLYNVKYFNSDKGPRVCNISSAFTPSPHRASCNTNMSMNTYTVPAAYIRIGSTSIAAYELVVEFYETEWKSGRVSVSLCLFVLIRVTSIALLIISNIGFFYDRFSYESCHTFYLIAPILKALQITVSQCIMGVRTYNISGRSRGIGSFLLVFYVISCGVRLLNDLIVCPFLTKPKQLQWYANIYKRTPSFDPAVGDCLGKLLSGNRIGSWFYYVVAIVYDVTTTSISIYYLLNRLVLFDPHGAERQAFFHRIFRFIDSRLRRLFNSMLYDGMGYFVMLTGEPVQTAAVTIGYVMTWLMSQKLIINQYKARMHHRLTNRPVVPTKPQRPILAPGLGNRTGSTVDISTSPIITSLQVQPTDTDIYYTKSNVITDDEAELGCKRGGTISGDCEDRGRDVVADVDGGDGGGSERPPNGEVQVRLERSVYAHRFGRLRGPDELSTERGNSGLHEHMIGLRQFEGPRIMVATSVERPSRVFLLDCGNVNLEGGDMRLVGDLTDLSRSIWLPQHLHTVMRCMVVPPSKVLRLRIALDLGELSVSSKKEEG